MKLDTFTPEHVEALQTVDVRLYGGIHGKRVPHPIIPNLDMALGVCDDDYADVLDWTQSFNGEYGDTVGVEGLGFREADRVHTLQGFFGPGMPNSAEHLTVERRSEAKEGLNELAHNFVKDPFSYAVGHLILKGISVEYADLNETMHDQVWSREGRDRWAQRLSATRALLSRAEVARERYCREQCMLATLGRFAQEVPEESRLVAASKSRLPRVGLLVGFGHLSSLASALNQAQVPFTARSSRAASSASLVTEVVDLIKSTVGRGQEQVQRKIMVSRLQTPTD